MAEVSFRKLDVDRYDEDRVLPSDLYDPDPRPSTELLQLAKAKQATIRTHLQRGDVPGALGAGLADPPFGGEGEDAALEEAKTVAFQSVLSVLNSTKASDIPALVQSLSPTDQITLMKYLYKAMEDLGETNGNVILGWHEKLVEHAGTGCIVRVMTDRRRV